VLLVDHDHADVRERRDDGQPRPDDDIGIARPDPPPLVGPLPLAESRMDQGDPRLEIGAQPVDEGHRERDLGDEDERRTPGFE
jgi:hypothetical protein